MRILKLESNIPSQNLATEEYLLRNTNEDIFMLWRNNKSIIVGKNQNTYAEINSDFTQKNNIPVIRRLTGGGAVFHDLGNLNYTFIESNSDNKFGNYEVFAEPILKALKKLGIEACLNGRNDMCINDKKFSGNAQYMWHGRILHHGTLLFNADVSNMSDALKVNELKIKSKGIKSVKSRVTNIYEHLDNKITIDEFSDVILNEVLSYFNDCEIKNLNETELIEISKLCEEKYSTDEWNYGYKKEYTFHKETKLPCGLIQANMNIQNDKINEIRIEGDYFGRCEVKDFEDILTGIDYTPESLKNVVFSIENIDDYFSGCTTEQIFECLI